MNTRKAICSLIVLALLFAVVPVFGQSGYSEGLADGEQDGAADAELLGIVWGALFGIFNIGFVALTPPPDMPASRIALLDGKPAEYKSGYIDGYKNGRQARRLLYSGGGCGLFLLVSYVIASN